MQSGQLTPVLFPQVSLHAGDLEAIAKATEGYSGADLTALCREAAMQPLREVFAMIVPYLFHGCGRRFGWAKAFAPKSGSDMFCLLLGSSGRACVKCVPRMFGR